MPVIDIHIQEIDDRSSKKPVCEIPQSPSEDERERDLQEPLRAGCFIEIIDDQSQSCQGGQCQQSIDPKTLVGGEKTKNRAPVFYISQVEEPRNHNSAFIQVEA